MASQKMDQEGTHALRQADTIFVLSFYWLTILGVTIASALEKHLPIIGVALLMGALTTALWLRFENGAAPRLVTGATLALLSVLVIDLLRVSPAGNGLLSDPEVFLVVPLSVLLLWIDWRPVLIFGLALLACDLSGLSGLLGAGNAVGETLPLLRGAFCMLPAIVGWVLARNQARVFREFEQHLMQELELRPDARGAALAEDSLVKAELPDADRSDVDVADTGFAEVDLAAAELRNTQLMLEETVLGQQARDAEVVALQQQNAALSASAAETAQTMANMSHLADALKAEIGALAGSLVQPQEASDGARDVAEKLVTATANLSERLGKVSPMIQAAETDASDSNRKVASLSDAVARIGDVVTLINAVADRTNLLALNATIEAARAGDAGRGFAVVATEVKDLAQQTSSATSDITARIEAIRQETEEALEAIRQVSGQVENIADVTSAIVPDFAALSEDTSALRDDLNQPLIREDTGKAHLASIADLLTQMVQVAQALPVVSPQEVDKQAPAHALP
ncbi:MAG: hypothetical protein HWE23_14835 [Rhodobacteraceae bacterium]|nr:hypothetical protein [Paracoccaceae bacterium]